MLSTCDVMHSLQVAILRSDTVHMQAFERLPSQSAQQAFTNATADSKDYTKQEQSDAISRNSTPVGYPIPSEPQQYKHNLMSSTYGRLPSSPAKTSNTHSHRSPADSLLGGLSRCSFTLWLWAAFKTSPWSMSELAFAAPSQRDPPIQALLTPIILTWGSAESN